jgi:hypothetical protein
MRGFAVSRTLLIGLALVLAVAVPSAAQATGGVKGGIAVSTVATNPDTQGALGQLIDFAGIAFVAFDRRAPVTVQVEGGLTRRGAEIVTPIIDIGFGLGKVRVTYVDVSALARVRVTDSADSQLYVIAGPTISIKTSAAADVAGFGTDISAIVEDLDLGLAIGAGLETRYLLLEGRYTHGFRNVLIGVDFVGLSVRNRSFAFLAGLRF